MTFDEAARVLGVRLDGLTEKDVSIAFKRAIKLAHPDAGGSGDVATNITRAKKARDTLLRLVDANDALNFVCKTCKGSGQVPGVFAMAVCKRCKGTGREDLNRR